MVLDKAGDVEKAGFNRLGYIVVWDDEIDYKEWSDEIQDREFKVMRLPSSWQEAQKMFNHTWPPAQRTQGNWEAFCVLTCGHLPPETGKRQPSAGEGESRGPGLAGIHTRFWRSFFDPKG